MRRITITLILLAGVIIASTRVYEIEPFQNCNGWTQSYPYNHVGQIFVATCDSFLWVDFFVGAPNDTGYNVEIQEYPSGEWLFRGYAQGKKSYDYTRANLSKRPGSAPIIKGKTYELKITNVNGDSINYYYDSRNTYKYGNIVVGGIAEPGPKDLAARVEGITRIPQDLFGTEINISGSDTNDNESC
jgi:hypothetical protein